MIESLRDVGDHHGSVYSSDGDGHYEAYVDRDGSVKITIVYDTARQNPVITLPHDRWDRLAAWVEWRRNEWNLREKEGE